MLRPGPGVTEQPAIPLARPDVGERELELIAEVIDSCRLSLGPMAERFERDFATAIGAADAVAVSSGTTALHLGVRRLGWGPGDEVITSPLSFVASANCVLYEGATPVFADVDPLTLDLDPAAAEAAAGERTAGLLPVHIFGWPAAMGELEALAVDLGLGILEDGCEALGARDGEGRAVGSRGNLCAFGFYANKQLTTGEGGMLIPRDPDEAALLRSERNQGRALDMGWLDHDRLGFNYRLSDIAAAVGVAQLERLSERLAARVRIAAIYRDALIAIGGSEAATGEEDGIVLPPAGRGEERRSWFVYVVQLPADRDRDGVIAALAAAGVQSKAYLPCIHLMPHYRERFGFREGQFPVAERFSSRALALPFFPSMEEAQVARVCEALAAAVGTT
jgi:perosamine synthetase